VRASKVTRLFCASDPTQRFTQAHAV